jgi:ferredoxin
VRVQVDRDLCESNGMCVQVAPTVFTLDDDDELHILQEEPEEALRDRVEDAVRRCPKQALSLAEP